MEWTAKTLAEAVQGTLYGDVNARTAGCVLDSRQVQQGNLFIAFSGAQTDGHAYLQGAWDQGAAVVIGEKAGVEKYVHTDHIPEGKALIVVDNSLQSMQNLAKSRVHKLGVKVVGITGSNGKTTTKDMTAAVLSRKYKVYASQGNHNNELGLPLTILNAPEDTEILILEMGMRGLGQIKALCEIAPPHVAVITNIGTTHMELLGTQENIARAKWELVEALPRDSYAVLNAEDLWSVKKSREVYHPVRFYGMEGKYALPDVQGMGEKAAGVLGTEFTVTWGAEKATTVLPLPGRHNVLDALAALTVGTLFHVSLAEGCESLKELQLTKMRLELLTGLEGSTLISDVYNANPVSMQASLRILKERGSGHYTVAVLGDMYELGDLAVEGHRQVGRAAAQLKMDALITVGPLAEEIGTGALEKGFDRERLMACTTTQAASELVRNLLREHQGAWVLLKGSRGMKMEEITADLLDSLPNKQEKEGILR